MFKPKLLIRLSAGCLLFFAMGHSIGHFTRYDVTDPKAKEILQMMTDNKFDMFGYMRSYDDNYTGMSLNIIFTLIAFAIVFWFISSIAMENKKLSVRLLLPIALCVFGFSITSYLYFFHVPVITCLIASALSAIAIFKLSTTD